MLPILADLFWDPFSQPSQPPSTLPTPSLRRVLFQDDDPNDIPAFEQADAVLKVPYYTEEMVILCTNFLLYVAMIIITCLVCKIYFPWMMDGKTSPVPESAPNSPARPTLSKRAQPSLDDSDEDSDTEDPTASFLNPPVHQSTSNSGRRKSFVPTSLNHTAHGEPNVPLQTEPPVVVFRRLMFCSIGLIATFVTWGYFQERICAHRYPRITGEFFPYTYFLVFTNRLWSLLFSVCLVAKSEKGFRWIPGVLIYEYSFPSISNMLSSWCQYEALKYVTFPAQTLFKSFKIGPVMLMGKLLGNRAYPIYDYVTVLIVGCGISMFMLGSPENVEFDRGIHADEPDADSIASNGAITTGIILLLLFLFFDSFTGQFQSRMFSRHPTLTVPELLFFTNAFSTVLSLITLVHTSELQPAIDFVMKHSEIHLHFFIFSICSTVGQLLIFYTIKNFGAVIFAIIMVVRVLISIVVSCIMYGHEIDVTGFAGLIVVLGGVMYRVKSKAEGQQLILFSGVSHAQGKIMVSEWREHLDM